jgi:hypothetical protein
MFYNTLNEQRHLTGVMVGVALHVKPDKMPELKRETFTA